MNSKYSEINDFLDEISENFYKFLKINVMQKDLDYFKSLVIKISEIFEFKMNKYLNNNSLDFYLNKKYEQVIELEKKVKYKYDISFCNTI